MKHLAILGAACLCALLAAPISASAAIYKFVQTGVSTVPDPDITPPTFTAWIEVNGTLADLPTMSSADLWPFDPDNLAPIDYGNLLGLSIFTTASFPGSVPVTLADFGYPLNDFTFPMWWISPQGLYINSADNEFEFWIDGFGNSSMIGHRSDGGDCYLTIPACEAPGRWVTVPEPGTVWILAASLVVLSGCAVRRRRLGALAT
jgi:hypothetical protein